MRQELFGRPCFECRGSKAVPHCMKKDSRAKSLEAWLNGSVDLALYRKLETCMQT